MVAMFHFFVIVGRVKWSESVRKHHQNLLLQAQQNDAQSDGWQLSRLQVRCAALVAENDSLRMCLKEAADSNSALQAAIDDQDSALRCKASKHEREAISNVAELEQEAANYKGMLQELATSAEVLSKDNVALSSEVRQLRKQCEAERTKCFALEGRAGHLQVFILQSAILPMQVAYAIALLCSDSCILKLQ